MSTRKTTTEKGKFTEHIAFTFLQQSGYEIEAVNWRTGKLEIDIIAKKNKDLVFIEVKSRAIDLWGDPAVAVNHQKKKLLVRAASMYMEMVNYDGNFRFDIITVVGYEVDKLTIEHYEDAFFPGLDF